MNESPLKRPLKSTQLRPKTAIFCCLECRNCENKKPTILSFPHTKISMIKSRDPFPHEPGLSSFPIPSYYIRYGSTKPNRISQPSLEIEFSHTFAFAYDRAASTWRTAAIAAGIFFSPVVRKRWFQCAVKHLADQDRRVLLNIRLKWKMKYISIIYYSVWNVRHVAKPFTIAFTHSFILFFLSIFHRRYKLPCNEGGKCYSTCRRYKFCIVSLIMRKSDILSNGYDVSPILHANIRMV